LRIERYNASVVESVHIRAAVTEQANALVRRLEGDLADISDRPGRLPDGSAGEGQKVVAALLQAARHIADQGQR
jgi:hypothetical protein